MANEKTVKNETPVKNEKEKVIKTKETVKKNEKAKKEVKPTSEVKENIVEPKPIISKEEPVKADSKEKVVQKASPAKKEKKQKGNGTIVVILILIIIAMAGAFTYVIINRDDIFDNSVSTSNSDSNNILDTNNSNNENSIGSTSNLTPQEISENLKKEGFSFSVNIRDDGFSVYAYGNGENDGIWLNLDLNSNGEKSLSFRDISIDSDNDYTYAYLTGKSYNSSEKQKGIAEKWLKSHNISATDLEKALEYVYQNRVSVAYHAYFKDDDNTSDLSIVLNKDSLTLPYMGIADAALEVDDHFINYLRDESYKEELHKELITFFVKTYSGGKITVEENVDINTVGEYPITFTVTSEDGNTKKATAKIIIVNFSKASIVLDKETIQVTKGTSVDVMSGVSVSSDLPKSEQGHIETQGTVNTNKVGTYKVTYTYVPKEGTNEESTGVKTRTYNVVEAETKEADLSIKEYKHYALKNSQLIGDLIFENHSFTLGEGYPNAGGVYYNGTYAQSGSNITFYVTETGSEDGSESCNYVWHGKVSNGGKTVKVTYPNGNSETFSL